MAKRKTHDLTVKTGEYTDNYGQNKGRYENVGQVLTDDDGSQMLLLKRTFNPAGVWNPKNSDSVILSMFEIKNDKQEQPSPHNQAKQNGYQPPPPPELDDSIPF